jgi:N-acetylgalactosamine-6-sulfatase
MTRRDFARGLAASAGAARAARAAAPARPNIVLFLADDLGWGDLSSFGCTDIRTPHIDGIGRRGVRFTHHCCNAPECTPTRTALLTGRYQQRVGGLECAIGVANVGRYDDAEWLQKRGELGLPETETTFARILQRNGYDTAVFGKWHLGYAEKFGPLRHGFDECLNILGGNADYFTHREANGDMVLARNGKPLDRPGYVTDIFADEAIAWLRRRAAKPFFLYMPFTAPHTPLQDPDGFDPKTGTAPTRPRERGIYAKIVERMDRRIGDVLAQVHAMGAENRTIVIFLSDNGPEGMGNGGTLRGRKSSLWEGGIRTPGNMHWPGRIEGGRTFSSLIMSMDFAPTLLGAAGVAPPPGVRFDGIDMLPAITGRRPPQSRTVFWRFKRLANVRKAVMEGDLKLVIDNGAEELHNLATDQSEEKNLLPGAAADAARLKRKLADWERDVMAPRLREFRSTPG